MNHLTREKVETLISEGRQSTGKIVDTLNRCTCGKSGCCKEVIPTLPDTYLSTTLGCLSALETPPHLVQGHEFYSGNTKKHGVLLYVRADANDPRLSNLLSEFRAKLALLGVSND